MIRAELLERIRKAVDSEPLERAPATEIAEWLERAPGELLEPLLEAGQELGRRGHGREITFSRNVFIPLTNLCRNRCAYCTFAKGIKSEEARSYQMDEVRETSRRALEGLGVDGLTNSLQELRAGRGQSRTSAPG